MTNERSGWVHRLTDKNEETLTGICANCGPVELVRKGQGLRCKVAIKEQKGKRYKPTAEQRRRYKQNWLAKNPDYKYPTNPRAVYTYDYADGRVILTKEERDAMFAALGDDPKCELCERELAGNMANLDHCHETGVFRGWLCRQCNTALGQLGDDVEGLQRAIAYLNKGDRS